DGAVGDLFTVQDSMIQAIVATLPGRMDEAGARAAQRKQPENLNAYECYLRGLAQIYEFDFMESPAAREMLERAISLDAHFARPYALLAVLELRHWWRSRSSGALAQAFKLAQKSVQLDQNDSLCQCSLGMACLQRREFADVDFHFHRALALNPNDSRATICWAELLAYSGEPAEAMTALDRAFRLDPFAPQWYHSVAGMVLFCAREYEKAISS